jgi:hypothetical protein
MKTLISVLALAVSAFAGSAYAADAASGPTKQQTKMATCNKDAGDKKGDERKAFMSECLKKEKDGTAQQNKMKTCSADFKATKKPGSERQAFMKECLSK